ncbi:hypothetical protein N665_0015s0013 [Sinapis alba]|nr:hypothetical protein N665_0015s0013 [Sinapis alba]
MNTVDIYEFDPWELPCKSRMKSTDEVWYFFGCKKNQQNRGERQSRRTKSGFWKKTGDTVDILRKRGGGGGGGGDGEKIGEKRVLVFQYSKIPGGSKPKSDWVMHEYIATLLSPPNQTMMTYIVCKVMFKGDPIDLPSSSFFSSSSSSATAAAAAEHHLSLIPHVDSSYSGGLSTETEVESSFELQNPRHFTGFLHLEEETQLEDAIRRAIDNLSTDDWNSLLNNNDDVEEEEEEQENIMLMQEDRNDYRPKMSLTSVFICHSDDDSDSDSISSTRTTRGSIKTSSTCVNFGCSNHPIHLPESPCSSIESGSVTQEMSEALGTNTFRFGFGSGSVRISGYGFYARTKKPDLYPVQHIKNTRMDLLRIGPKRCYKKEPKSEKPDPNANGYPNAQA